jgi:hypothetical protein
VSIFDLSRVGMKPAGWRGCDAKHAAAAARGSNRWPVVAGETKATESCNQLATAATTSKLMVLNYNLTRNPPRTCHGHGFPVSPAFAFRARSPEVVPQSRHGSENGRGPSVAPGHSAGTPGGWMAMTGRADGVGALKVAPPAWKLALQQHTRSPGRSSRSLQASPSQSHRREGGGDSERSLTAGLDIDYHEAVAATARVDDDLLMIRDLADDLLDSLGWSGGSQHSRDKEREGRGPNAQGRCGAAAAGAPSGAAPVLPGDEARGASQSPAAQQQVFMWEGARPADGPIRMFSPSRPASVTSATSATSATASDRKRRTRRSSANSSVLDELDTADLLGLDRMAQQNSAGPRPLSAHGRVGEGPRLEWSRSPQASRMPVRSKTALGPFSDEAQSQLTPPSVYFSDAGEGLLRDSVRPGAPRSGSPSRPTSPSGLPSYLQPSAAYLRSLVEDRPNTPGLFPRALVGSVDESCVIASACEVATGLLLFSRTGHRDRFAVSRTAPGPGAYTPVGFANSANHPTPARESCVCSSLICPPLPSDCAVARGATASAREKPHGPRSLLMLAGASKAPPQ